MLEQGLNPQWLAMEGSRIVDEKRHRGESLEEEGDEPLIEIGSLLHGEAGVVPQEENTAPNGSTVFLIDDDKSTRERLGAILSKRGFTVFLFEKIDEYVPAIRAANHQTGNLILVIDMIIPRPDGSGILGGMDLLEQVRSEFPHLPVVMISDHPDPEMERKVRQLGAPAVVGKPRKSEVREERGERALEALADVIAELNARTGKEATAAGCRHVQSGRRIDGRTRGHRSRWQHPEIARSASVAWHAAGVEQSVSWRRYYPAGSALCQ